MGEENSSYDGEKEAEWIDSTLTGILDKHTTHVRVTTHSKRWWTLKVETRRKEYGGTRRLYKQGRVNGFTLRTEQNSYYYTLRRTKRHCCIAFLQESDEVLGDSKQCRTALRYTQP